MKLYLLSDNVDTLHGMRLAGVEGEVVHERDAFAAAIARAVQDKRIGILLVTEKLSADFPDLVKNARLRGKTPLLVEIPDRHGNSKKSDAIAAYVREAVGIRI